MSDAEKNLKNALRESMRINGDDRTTKGNPLNAQQIFNVLIGIVIGVSGWLGNNVWGSIQTQQQQITQLNIELAKNYVPRVELQQQFDRINMKLDAIDQQTRRTKP